MRKVPWASRKVPKVSKKVLKALKKTPNERYCSAPHSKMKKGLSALHPRILSSLLQMGRALFSHLLKTLRCYDRACPQLQDWQDTGTTLI